MSVPVPWLPDACLQDERLTQGFGAALVEWSARWIAGPPWLPSPAWHEQADEPAGWAPLREGRQASLLGAPGAVLQLALAMLGERERTNFTRRDLKFLRRLAGQALDDLQARVDALMPGDTGALPPAAALRSLDIANGADPLLRIAVPRAVLCVLARAAFPRSPARPLEPRQAVVGEIPVPVAACFGSAKLGLAQLEALEQGDLIVLDRLASEGPTLLIAGLRSPHACTLAEQDARMSLHLIDPS